MVAQRRLSLQVNDLEDAAETEIADSVGRPDGWAQLLTFQDVSAEAVR